MSTPVRHDLTIRAAGQDGWHVGTCFCDEWYIMGISPDDVRESYREHLNEIDATT